jgi:membrane protein YdbS with pleckstrin-like domain/DNA-directed RNA polymerase subunit RPC12/RpoP
MNSISCECPQCHQTLVVEESLRGRRVTCQHCQSAIIVPPAPGTAGSPVNRPSAEPASLATPAPAAAEPETDVFSITPVARAFAGRMLIGVILIVLGAGLALRAREFSVAPWTGLIPAILGLSLLLQVQIQVRSCRYRLTTERLFVRRGWLARHVNELELYRVKDVRMDQGGLQRLLGYGTVTVLAEDDTTPEVGLIRIARPTAIKELIRTHYRAARQREGVHPAEIVGSL